MSLSIAIVGLPNVGKSTMFNALLRKQAAYAANFPFATIEPNVGIVPVPDKRLKKLAEVIKESEGMIELPPEVPATVEFVDIAGLIAGAHEGEGLGNNFLAHIRATDAICHVVRDFKNEDIVREGSVNPVDDLKTIEMELALADLETLERQKEPKANATNEEKHRWEAILKLKPQLEKGLPARKLEFTDEETREVKQLSLLTSKAILIVLNVSEEDLKDISGKEKNFAKEVGVDVNQVVGISARLEEELAALSYSEAAVYLNEVGINQTGLERLIRKEFATLGLITFLTAGEKEVRAWTIKKGMKAPHAAGVIHTDFEKKFIKADMVNFEDFTKFNGWKECRDKGKVRSEGKEYIVKDGDVIEFKVGQ